MSRSRMSTPFCRATITINGAPNTSKVVVIDGVNVIDELGTQAQVNPNIDAVGEVRALEETFNEMVGALRDKEVMEGKLRQAEAARTRGGRRADGWGYPMMMDAATPFQVMITPEETLIRELDEELGVRTKVACLAPLTFASHSYDDFHLLLPLYICRRWDGTPFPREHQALKWIRPRDLIADPAAFPMPAADLPLLPMLRDLL